ncbi:MAG: PD-(D/E)XK nuclease family protein [Clostridia bacterium]|nr:PD-(D/E)XK nuclease family protein [Clostridia bacterium]
MRIITARPHRLLGEVIDRIGAAAQEGKRCMLLVPSQYTLQAEIEVMTRLNLEGTFMIDVLSPGRLKSRIFERAGQPERVIFDERGKCMVLSSIIEQEKENLGVYRAAAQQGATGLAQKMSSLIADIKRSGKTAQEIILSLEAMDERTRNLPSSRKLADAARIYAGYERRMEGQLYDSEDVSREMRERMARSGVLENQHVFVFGFDMITPVFAKELLEMASLAGSLTLAVETDENGAPDGRLFAPVNFSIERLAMMAAERGTAVQREHIEREIDAPEDIRALEREMFALGGKAQQGAPEHIELLAVSSPRQEVHMAAAKIRRRLPDGEDSARMAVVYPKDSGYAPLLAAVLPQYGVAAYLAEKRPAGAHPLCRFVLSALAAATEGWRTADVVECIRSGFLHLTAEQADALCSYLEGMDIRGDSIKKPFRYSKEKNEEALAQLNESRERVVEPLSALQAQIRSAKDADGAISAVIALLESVNAYDTLADMRAALREEGLEPEAEDCAQVWNALMETLDQLHTLLTGEDVSAKLVLRLLESGLSALELSALPPADGAVICGEIGNVRTARVDTLFALGMNDMGGSADTGLFTPQEKQEAAGATGAYLGMSAAERAALSQLDELKTLTNCCKRLIVSYALADETGRALRPGAAVQAMRRIFPDMPVRGGLAKDEREMMLCAPDAALEALSVQLSGAADGQEDMDAAYAQAYAALARSEQGREKLLTVTRQLGAKPKRSMDAGSARALYGRPVMSVSRLETFAQCPYRHYVQFGLAPKEELKPGVDRAELGTLYHEAAERFTREVTQLAQFPQVDDATCDRIMDEAVQPLIEEWRKSPLGESERGAAIARRVKKTARRAARSIVSQFAGSSFRPMHSEMVFGRNGLAPIMLELPDGMFVYLQGRIDRIDVLDTGSGDARHIRIVDYKSGAKKFDPTMVYYGIQLQLLLYLAAALAQIPGSQAAGFFYCRIADPTVKSESRIKEEIERQIAKSLALAGVSLSEVEVLRAQDARHAAMITKDGKPGGQYRSSLADAQSMDAMVAFARGKAAQMAQEAYAGVIDDAPAEHGQYSACAYCSYSAICGFDPAVKQKRMLEKKSMEDLC